MQTEFLNYGLNSLMTGNYNSAVDHFSKSIDKQTDNYDGFLYRGIAYFNLGEYSSALSDLNTADKLSENKFEVLYNRARTNFHNQNFKDAQDDIEKAKSIAITEDELEKLSALTNRFS